MDWTKQIVRYIVVMMLQVLLFDQLQLWGACHPYIYILCLLMLPITLPRSADLLIGAAVGLIMDIFCNSLGIHMAGCILIMFLRPYILNAIVSDTDRLNEQICLRAIGMSGFIKYIGLLVVIHHLTVFMIAAWSWSHLWFVLMETVVSSIITILAIIGYNSLKYR